MLAMSMKPYMTTSRGVLFHDDCMNVLVKIRSNTIDCVFADPPFNLGKNYNNGFNDKITEADYYSWCFSWIEECSRIIRPGGAFFIYALPGIAVRFAGHLNKHMQFRHWIALSMKGTYSRGKKLYPAHYALLYYTKGEPNTFNHVRLPIPVCRHCGKEIKDYGGHRNKLNPLGLNLTDFWEDTSPNRHKKFKVRPGVNELKATIPERAILISTNPGDIILDPFGGGGSTFQAAESSHRYWIGIELHDCDHIRRRLFENFPDSVDKDPLYSFQELFKNENHENQVLRWGQG